jgi:aromatic-L-amino-acid/L-tryptophan decarboxylase
MLRACAPTFRAKHFVKHLTARAARFATMDSPPAPHPPTAPLPLEAPPPPPRFATMDSPPAPHPPTAPLPLEAPPPPPPALPPAAADWRAFREQGRALVDFIAD